MSVLGPLAAGAAALGLMVAGGLLLLRSLPSAAPDLPPPVAGRKRPADFGLPAYPGSFSHFSTESGDVAGSVAFSVRRGTAREIAAFYRRELEADGWRFAWQERSPIRLGGPEETSAPTAPALMVLWTRPAEGRQITLTALDLRSGGGTGQAVLHWGPLEADSGE